MRSAIIQAAALAAMFLIAAAVSYHSGYVGGRVDGEAERLYFGHREKILEAFRVQ